MVIFYPRELTSATLTSGIYQNRSSLLHSIYVYYMCAACASSVCAYHSAINMISIQLINSQKMNPKSVSQKCELSL